MVKDPDTKIDVTFSLISQESYYGKEYPLEEYTTGQFFGSHILNTYDAENAVIKKYSVYTSLFISNFSGEGEILKEGADVAILALGSMVAFVALIYTALRTPAGRRASDFFFLHVPLIAPMIREVNAARTARTLASLLSSGVDVLQSLAIVGEVVQNYYFRLVIADAEKRVRQGEPLSSAFIQREDLYPQFVGEMAAVGEETGALAEMLKRLAIFYEDEVDRKTKDMSTIVEPFLMLLIGSAVGFFAVSMMAPIYQLSQNIG